MNLPFVPLLALRFLREGRLQTLFIISGIAIGVGVIVFMSAMLSGLQTNFLKRVLSAQAHIQVLAPQQQARALRMPASVQSPGLIEDAKIQPPLQKIKTIDQWQNLAKQIASLADVNVVAPVAAGSALIVRGNSNRAISLTGVESQTYFRIVNLSEKLQAGNARLNAGDILIGVELANDLGVSVGDKLHLTTANGAAKSLTIQGLLDLGSKAANQRSCFVALRTAQSLLGLPGGVSSLEVTLNDVWQAEIVAQRIQSLAAVQADSWIKTGAQFFAAVSAQTTANTAIRFFVGLSVAFGVASVLVVVVVQKSREIGILRAMGITRSQILQVFLLQGGLLGLAGGTLGCVIGALALVLWNTWAKNADGTPMFAVDLNLPLYLSALALAAITGIVAAFAPALRAARLDPVEAIRG